jgi:hypothetical protein
MLKASLFNKFTSFKPYFSKQNANFPNFARHTPDQIPDNKLESFSIRDRDALFYSLPDRPAPTHHAERRDGASLARWLTAGLTV